MGPLLLARRSLSGYLTSSLVVLILELERILYKALQSIKHALHSKMADQQKKRRLENAAARGWKNWDKEVVEGEQKIRSSSADNSHEKKSRHDWKQLGAIVVEIVGFAN